jgi:hypothetical protein
VAFFQHDESDMARQVEAARRFPDGYRIITSQASVALYQGQLERAKGSPPNSRRKRRRKQG